MGFFKDFKDDFSQALSELLPGDEFSEEEIQVNTLDNELDVEQELSKLDGLLEQVEKKSSQMIAKEEPGELSKQSEVLQEEPEVKDDPAEVFEDLPKDEPEQKTLLEQACEKDSDMENESGSEGVDVEPLPELLPLDEFEVDTFDKPVSESEPFKEDAIEEPEEDHLDEMIEEAVKEELSSLPEHDVRSQTDIPAAPVEKATPKATDLYNINKKDIMKEEKSMDTMDTTVTNATLQTAEPAVEADIKTAVVGSEVTDEVSVITAGTKIKGNMETTGSFEIEGKIEGDIKCNGKLTVIGTIVGNSASSEFFADSAHIEGEVVSSGTVKVGLGSVIIGNITATSAVIAGAVKGDIDVQGPVVVDTSAVIMGNIKSRSVQINNGAVIEGFCSQCYSDVDVESLFSKNK